MPKHKNIPAIYTCLECKKDFKIPPSDPPINPKCIYCENVYVNWINFAEYLKQWE